MKKKQLDVVAALIKKGGKILLCQRKVNDHYGGLWEFPGGCVEEKESREEAIEREIKEEAGLKVKAKRFLQEFYDEDPDLIINVYLFECVMAAGKALPLECKDLGFFSFKEAGKLNLAPVDRKVFNYLAKKT